MSWKSPSALFLPTLRADAGRTAVRDWLQALQQTHLACPTSPVGCASLSQSLLTPATDGPTPPSRRTIVSHSACAGAPCGRCSNTRLTHTTTLSRKFCSSTCAAAASSTRNPFARNRLQVSRSGPSPALSSLKRFSASPLRQWMRSQIRRCRSTRSALQPRPSKVSGCGFGARVLVSGPLAGTGRRSVSDHRHNVWSLYWAPRSGATRAHVPPTTLGTSQGSRLGDAGTAWRLPVPRR